MAYLLEEMIDKLGFVDGNPHWQTPDHRRVAMRSLLGNRHINSRDRLMECVKIINTIPEDEIRTITFDEIEKLGVPIQ